MQTHILTVEETANYHNDEVRAAIRSNVAERFPEGALIVGSNNELFDTLGPIGDSIELAAVVSEEEIELREHAKLLEAQEIAHFENDIKPKVILKITSDVKREFRDQLRDRANENLALKAELHKTQIVSVSALKASTLELATVKLELATLHDTYSQLLEGHEELAGSYEKTLSELTTLQETHAQLLKEYNQLNESLEAVTKPDSTEKPQ
jgi:hypothetical protein